MCNFCEGFQVLPFTSTLELRVAERGEALPLEVRWEVAGGCDLSGVLLLFHHLRQPH